MPTVLAVTAMASVPFGSAMAASSSIAAKVGQESLAEKILVPHRAIYDIRMRSAKSGSQILDVRGKMYYSLNRSCAGWITDHRFTLTYDYSDMSPVRVTTRFASFENFSGTKMDFSSSRTRNGDVDEEIRGKARIGHGTDKAGDKTGDRERVALYSMPSDLKFDLPVGALFPVAHTARLIEAARRGDKIMNAVVFDGSDDQGPVEINAVMSPQKVQKFDAPYSPKYVDMDLLKSPVWSASLAVFSLGSSDPVADYELNMTLLENGIVREMNVDYHDFSIEQKLVALQKLPQEECKD